MTLRSIFFQHGSGLGFTIYLGSFCGISRWYLVLNKVLSVQEDTDKSFIKKHQSVVKEQTAQWVNSEPGIVGALVEMNPSFPEVHGFEPSETFEGNKKLNTKSGKQGNSSLVSHSPKPPSGKIQGNKAGPLGEAGPSGDGHDKSNVENGAQGTMSDETRMALPGALKEIFAKHHVCT